MDDQTKQRDLVEDKLQLLNKISSVHHPLKHIITSDFIYTKLEDKQKDFIIEMTHSAGYGERLLERIKKGHKKWNWNKEGYWEKKNLTNEEKSTIDQLKKNLFNTFMTRAFMIVTLNINKKDNPHVAIMAGAINEETKQDNQEEEVYTYMDKLANKFKGEQKK